MLEVELKYPLADVAVFRERLSKLPMRSLGSETQVDTYFNHPVRDFAQTDEAVRCRVAGDRAWLTYKGPLVDRTTKTREEIELPAGTAADGQALCIMLTRLGFRRVLDVPKTRESWTVTWQERELTVSLDHVVSLGWFCEVETLAEEEHLSSARDAVQQFAESLGLRESQRKSYLSMLLEQSEKKLAK